MCISKEAAARGKITSCRISSLLYVEYFPALLIQEGRKPSDVHDADGSSTSLLQHQSPRVVADRGVDYVNATPSCRHLIISFSTFDVRVFIKNNIAG